MAGLSTLRRRWTSLSEASGDDGGRPPFDFPRCTTGFTDGDPAPINPGSKEKSGPSIPFVRIEKVLHF